MKKYKKNKINCKLFPLTLMLILYLSRSSDIIYVKFSCFVQVLIEQIGRQPNVMVVNY